MVRYSGSGKQGNTNNPATGQNRQPPAPRTGGRPGSAGQPTRFPGPVTPPKQTQVPQQPQTNPARKSLHSQQDISATEVFVEKADDKTEVFEAAEEFQAPDKTQVMSIEEAVNASSIPLSPFEQSLYTRGIVLEKPEDRFAWSETDFSKALFAKGLILSLPSKEEEQSEDEEEVIPLYKKWYFWLITIVAAVLVGAVLWLVLGGGGSAEKPEVLPQSGIGQTKPVEEAPQSSEEEIRKSIENSIRKEIEASEKEAAEKEAAATEAAEKEAAEKEAAEKEAAEKEADEKEAATEKPAPEPVKGTLVITVSAPDGANMGYILNGNSEKTAVNGNWTKDFPLADLKGPVNIIVKGRNGETPVTCEITERGNKVSNGYGDEDLNEATCSYTPSVG